MTVNLYASPQLRRITGDTIRPGGMRLTDRAIALCRLPAGARVLDVGCGSGATAAHLGEHHGMRACGLDLSPDLLAEARRKHAGLPLIRGSGGALCVRSGVLHALICECVLTLMPDPASALKGFHRVLTSGGFLILTDLYDRAPDRLQPPPDPIVRSCLNGAAGKARTQTQVAAAGFNIILYEDHSPLLATLAAEMAWAGMPASKFVTGECGPGECAGGAGAGEGKRAGYYLLLAKKVETRNREEPHDG